MADAETAAAERKRIRAATVAHLAGKGIVAAGRVHNSRIRPIAAAQTPALNVFTPTANGKNERQNLAAPRFEYDLALRVDIHVADGDDWAGVGDDVADAVEKAIFTDTTYLALIGISGFSWHRTTITPVGDGEDRIALVAIEFGLLFDFGYEPVVADAFAGADVEVDAIDPADANTGHEGDEGGYPGGYPGPDGRTEARLTINVETEE